MRTAFAILVMATGAGFIAASGCDRSEPKPKIDELSDASTKAAAHAAESSPHEHGDGNGKPAGAAVATAAETAVFLTPGGKYTEADIAANGRTVPSIRFRGIKSAHDDKPKADDPVCPISGTKANPLFAWTVDGQNYLFCCPPCVEEFVEQAKSRPASLRPAAAFLKR